MLITKYLHSCLIIQENNIDILIDPGIYTYQEKALDINSIQKLDYILITHEHFDHMHIPFIKELLAKFPNVIVISNESVQKILGNEGIGVSSEPTEFISFEEVTHEKIVGIDPPQNFQFDLFNRFTDPGDSHSFMSTQEILALPIQAPWGSYSAAIEKAVRLKPKIVIPIHDWHWKDEVRVQMYKRSEEFLKQYGIDFKSVATGQTIEV